MCGAHPHEGGYDMSGWLGRIAASVALAAVILTTSQVPVAAQQPAQQPAQPGAQQQPQPQPAPPAGPNLGRISINGGVDIPNKYYFRGIVQETEDFIMQPYLNLTFKLYEDEAGVLNAINVTTGIWNSLHWGPTGSTPLAGDPHRWYEADVIAGVNAVLFKDLTLGVTYTAYTSPNGFFNTVQEIALGASFNDSKLLGAFALNPSVTLAFELDGQADAGLHKGIYLQLGVAPGLTVNEGSRYPVTITFPATLGLSLDDYYERIGVGGSDDTFGYFDFGMNLSLPLAFIPASFGSWQLKGGLHGLVLGDNLRAANPGNSRMEFIGSIGIAFTY